MDLREKISLWMMLLVFSPIGLAQEKFCALQTNSLPNFGCELSCHINKCKKYFADDEFTCEKYCARQSFARIGAEVLLKCGKGMTWDVVKGTVMTPIAIWEAAVAQADAHSDFIEFCDGDIKCKRQLALEAAMVHPDGSPYSDLELAKIESFDLVRKRTAVREMATRDQAYRQKLRGWKVPLPDIDSNETPLDALFAFALKRLKDQGIKWDCYNAADRTEMICAAAGSILLPMGAAKLAGRLAKYLPKERLNADVAGEPAVEADIAMAAEHTAAVEKMEIARKVAKETHEAFERSAKAYIKAMNEWEDALKDLRSQPEKLAEAERNRDLATAAFERDLSANIVAEREASLASIKLARLSGRPNLANLEEYLLRSEKELGHKITHESGEPVLNIKVMQGDQQKFMVLAMRAIDEGSLKSIQANRIVGPKAVTTISSLAKRAIAKGRDLKIEGVFDRNKIEDIHRTRRNPFAKNGIEKWTAGEETDYQQARRDLDIQRCPAQSCKIVVEAKDGKITIEISPD